MNTKEMLLQFEETVDQYIRDLKDYSLEQLLWKPAEDEWSLGQMFGHLIGSAQFLHLRNVALCLEPDGSPAVSTIGKTQPGEEVYSAGSFPPVRVQVPPSPQYTPPQPESKDQLVDGLRNVVRRMVEMEPAVAAAFDPGSRELWEPGKEPAVELVPPTVAHPRFGGLNALEWFQLIEMHYRHHFLQKKRLEDAWREMQVKA
ncbi:DinB family protein [Paenibacillus aurantius]|uniref:DinB family protein n=1 Tax=Paenibacillus aurantius TaxID=2918900 RepID=A0AA96RFH4_9BACL|nr:DinB family protein [Paenibacillus aurantius]WNQ11456.1 DinB family protein [Paenibacillus aurantius]